MPTGCVSCIRDARYGWSLSRHYRPSLSARWRRCVNIAPSNDRITRMSSESDDRPSHARLASWIVPCMFALAAVAVAFTLLTQDYRREIDTYKPDPPNFRTSMWMSLIIFGVVTAFIWLLATRFNRRK